MEKIRTKTGKSLDDITIENIFNGTITSEDIKVSEQTLLKQARIATENGRPQMGKNFTRAAELTEVPDDLILKVYEMLRPNRSTRKELITAAQMLKSQYGAGTCSEFILETLAVYEKRGILRKESIL